MSAARLEVTDAHGWRVVPVARDLFRIGRHATSDLRLSDADISRDHAHIVRTDGRFLLCDRGSGHGTFVNGDRIVERVLEHGDRIQCGASGGNEIVFLIDEAGAAHRAAGPGELRQIAALLDKLRALGSGRVLDEVLTLVLDSALDLTGADRGFIMLADPQGRLEFKLARSRGRRTLPGRSFDTSRKIPEAVFSSGRQAIVEDLLDRDLAPLHTGTVALGIRHVLCTPLRVVRYVESPEERGAEEVIGVLYLDSGDRAALKSSSAQAALETLSAEAALAIQNARLYRDALDKAKFEQELRVAAAFQRALLPPAVRTGPFYRAAALSLPCRAVGGDFFDYVTLPGGEFGFIVGDVAGKGAAAALLAAAMLGMFSAEAGHPHRPASLVGRLNQGLCARTIDARFLTTFYGILAPDGRLSYSNAGHNPPVLLSTAGVRRLTAGGVVLGVFDEAGFDEETVVLAPGDLVVVFSDGVTDAMDRDDAEFGDGRLLAAIESHRHEPPDAIVDAITTSVRAFTGGEAQSDDLTIVAVRYEG